MRWLDGITDLMDMGLPPSSQDEALASYSVSVEALRSILKFKTIIVLSFLRL